MSTKDRIHLLKQITLPARFGNLYEAVGPDVTKLLVRPKTETASELETASLAINAKGEGLFLPLYGNTGKGKTTLARSLGIFFSSSFSRTIDYTGEISYGKLNEVVEEERKCQDANSNKIVPINFDHRESNPPSDKELSEIKRFLRSPSLGARSIVLWPETSLDRAKKISKKYVDMAGKPAIDIPLEVEGPPRGTWEEIALNTLELVNNLSEVEELGVNPRNYDPDKYRSIGEYLGDIANDLATTTAKLIRETRKPLTLVINFVTGSHTAGVLSQLTNNDRFGLLDGRALVSATSNSRIGKWWKERMSLLTRTIYTLDAHAFSLPPASSVSILRTYGDEEVKSQLREMDIAGSGPKKVVRDFSRTDVGKYLLGEERSTFEGRGKPPEKSTPAFNLLAETGFTHGRDKDLNHALRRGVEVFCESKEVDFSNIKSEKELDFCSIIPDNSIHRSNEVVCLEYTWRKGSFLEGGNRATAAGYILKKLRSYARELDWTSD